MHQNNAIFVVKKLLPQQFSLKLSSFFLALHLNFLGSKCCLVGRLAGGLIGRLVLMVGKELQDSKSIVGYQ